MNVDITGGMRAKFIRLNLRNLAIFLANIIILRNLKPLTYFGPESLQPLWYLKPGSLLPLAYLTSGSLGCAGVFVYSRR